MKPIDIPELGILNLALVPAHSVRFHISPARSLHAATLRRLELIAPELSRSLHDSILGAHSTEHPLTVSSLLDPQRSEEDEPVAAEGRTYRTHIAALTPEVARTLDMAFHPQHPLGQEPLILEHVPFQVVLEETHWDNLATYASLLTMAKPQREIALEFCSPTGFRTRRESPVLPDPAICISGYLRKWNAFAPVTLPEGPLMAYVRNHIKIKTASLQPATHQLGGYVEHGFVGQLEWQAEDGFPALLRQVNALVDFACYCGTGMKTALGMGQTRHGGSASANSAEIHIR